MPHFPGLPCNSSSQLQNVVPSVSALFQMLVAVVGKLLGGTQSAPVPGTLSSSWARRDHSLAVEIIEMNPID